MSLAEQFQKKYGEFAADITATFPELEAAVTAALAMSPEERLVAYTATVLGGHGKGAAGQESNATSSPGEVLPGVVITEELWASASDATKKAVSDYRSILDMCAMVESGSTPSKEWAEKVMRDWRGRMDRVDFNGLAEKFVKMFGGEGGGSSPLPPLPEKFLKGKLAKLAEDMVKEFKPEDFGLRPEDLEAVEKDPTRAFEILMGASVSNPDKLQKAMARVAKKLQSKVASGALKPQELVAEAEELMKEFQSHPAFVEMMESFRSAFSFEDPEVARAAGQEQSARLALVRNRLRKKLEAKKSGGGAK